MKTTLRTKFILPLYLVAGLTLAGCHSKNSSYQGPITKPNTVETAAKTPGGVSDPKVNILFVVDNSGSMKRYQEKLSRNMKLFADQFFSNPRIDYKIGVVPVYDSKYLNDKTVYPKNGVRKMNPLGELVKLKGLDPAADQNQVYITRQTKNAKEVLQATVAIGVQWGPEAEESYSPVIAVMDPKINAEKNQNFYDPEAYLAIIFLTDADDVTPSLSADEFYSKLYAAKGNKSSKILIAAALPNIRNRSSECTTDGRGPVQSFPKLLARSGGIFADLCSKNFGNHLASFAKKLAERVASQKIKLGFTPDIDSLEVTYGTETSLPQDRVIIPRGPDGYTFDVENNIVIISSELNIERVENGQIFVKGVEADLANLQDGRTQQEE
ncbi:MAG: hypothetical protein H7061_02025 [Bdellovibrionaceae bacterium]|nr:hypothetical protein [Bdellovibrio sp.]